MLNWLRRWRKRDDPEIDSENSDPRGESDVAVLPLPEARKPPVKSPKTPKSGATDSKESRQRKFEQLGIPYKTVLLAEARARGIDPDNIKQETGAMNSKLKALGFDFRVSCLELFESQLVYLDYQDYRRKMQRIKKISLPEHSMIDVVVLREAERLVKEKHGLSSNPAAGTAAKIFQTEVKSQVDELRLKATERKG